MSLDEQITQDYIQAMKSRDSLKSGALNFLRAQLKNVRIEKKVEKLDDNDVIGVIKKQIKQRQDSIEQFRQGNRSDLVQKEEAELALLKGYLPQEMDTAQLQAIVQQAIKEVQAVSVKDMGKVMKAVLDKVGGRADSKAVSELVKTSLSKI